MPKFLLDDFTYQGRLPVEHTLYADEAAEEVDGDDATAVWTEKDVEALVSRLRDRNYGGLKVYSRREVARVARHLEDEDLSGTRVEGKHALVIGTQVSTILSNDDFFSTPNMVTFDTWKSRNNTLHVPTPDPPFQVM